jgi:hypothetical protein
MMKMASRTNIDDDEEEGDARFDRLCGVAFDEDEGVFLNDVLCFWFGCLELLAYV